MTWSTDHIWLDQKLTDIGWPTKILLPSIPDHRVLQQRWRDNTSHALNICTNAHKKVAVRRSVMQPSTNYAYAMRTNGYHPRIASIFCSWPTRVSLHVLPPKMQCVSPTLRFSQDARTFEHHIFTANHTHTQFEPQIITANHTHCPIWTIDSYSQSKPLAVSIASHHCIFIHQACHSATSTRFCAVIQVIQYCSVPVFCSVSVLCNGSTFTTNCGGV
jgi:hypothetical protein